MSEPNPFLSAAGDGAEGDATRREDWEEYEAAWTAHVAACEVLMRTGVLARLELAAAAVRELGYRVEICGITRTETFTGMIHLRAKMVLDAGTHRTAQLEFIGSPKSRVIAVEGGRGSENRRWRKMVFTKEGVFEKVDEIIKEFLRWGNE